MTRAIDKLSAVAVRQEKRPGMYGDGGGLYLQIADGGAKSWIFRYRVGNRIREMGLGPLHTVSLAEARGAALEQRQLRLRGLDPIEQRRAARLRAAAEAAKTITFREYAEQYIEAHKPRWSNAKHAAQWTSTLETYAYPIIGSLPVGAIDTGLVKRVLDPIWTTKGETATRVRQRIETILDGAATLGYRDGPNPARWQGHLEQLLPAQSKVRRVKHHAALPYNQIGGFMKALRAQEGVAARALEFAILTAARTNEILGAEWSEIDFDAKVWTVGAERMKAKREHRVPLSAPAIALLKKLRGDEERDGLVFPGMKRGKTLSNMSLLAVLKRMKRTGITAHGFRSTFRDWAAEETSFAGEVAEMALAHTVEHAVEAAYRRGDLFGKRRQLMDAWAAYCAA